MTRKLTQKERDVFATIGRMGGKLLYKKIGKAGMSARGKKGAIKRWANHKAKAVDNKVAL